MELQYIAQELLSRSMLLIYRALFCSLAACDLRKNWPKGRHDWTFLLKDWAPKFDSGVPQSRSKHPLQRLTVTGKPCGHGEEWIANSPAPLPSFAWFSAVLPESTGESRAGSWWAVPLPAFATGVRTLLSGSPNLQDHVAGHQEAPNTASAEKHRSEGDVDLGWHLSPRFCFATSCQCPATLP